MAGTVVGKATASITAQDVAATLTGFSSPVLVSVQVAGTFTATVTFEATTDGSTWVAIGLFPAATPTASVATTATSAGLFVGSGPLAVAGIRARVSAWTNNTSGIVTVRTVQV